MPQKTFMHPWQFSVESYVCNAFNFLWKMETEGFTFRGFSFWLFGICLLSSIFSTQCYTKAIFSVTPSILSCLIFLSLLHTWIGFQLCVWVHQDVSFHCLDLCRKICSCDDFWGRCCAGGCKLASACILFWKEGCRKEPKNPSCNCWRIFGDFSAGENSERFVRFLTVIIWRYFCLF